MGKSKVEELKVIDSNSACFIKYKKLPFSLWGKRGSFLGTGIVHGVLEFSCEELYSVLDGFELICFLIWDGDAKFFFNSIYQFIGIKAVCAEVFAEGCFHRDLRLFNLELFSDQCF